ncbi:hypothetical protein ACO1O0_006334 [Amphichorda felina]
MSQMSDLEIADHSLKYNYNSSLISRLGTHDEYPTRQHGARQGGPDLQTTLPPPYQDGDDNNGLDALSNASSTSSLPQYETVAPDHSSAAGFHPTLTYQVENNGQPIIALPMPPRPCPIPIHAVTPTGEIADKVYESVRPARNSGNSILYHISASTEAPVCATTYRFGPGRPPRIRLLGPDADVGCSDEEFEVVGRGRTTRAVSVRTHLGTFQWRYANKAERKAAGADSLLVLERVTTVARAGTSSSISSSKTEEQRRRVAQLVRSDEFRTAGTGRSTAGNGGRLMMDLREWAEGDCKGEARQMEVFVVASCIVMLKKEVDRRRLHQAIVIAGAVS